MRNIKSAKSRRRRLAKRAPKHLRLGVWLHDRKVLSRAGSLSLAVFFAGMVFLRTIQVFIESGSYELSPKAAALVGNPYAPLGDSLKIDAKQGTYEYNQGYKPGELGGTNGSPRFSATFNLDPSKGTTVSDPVTRTSVTFKPKFGMLQPKQDQNRLIYPLTAKNATKVVSLKTVGFKEDIIINKFQGDTLEFKYDLELPDGTELRLESNGSLAVYGADYNLLGDVSVGSDSDKQLLDKARQNAVKRNLLFTFPAPYIKEAGERVVSDKKAWFTLEGKELTVHATGLTDATYPLTIDPSVYIETAAKLMKGNNETNVDFDIDKELIQKSQTTGARIDAWEENLDMTEGNWDSGTAAAGGYIYRAGGRTGVTKPWIVSSQSSTQATNSATFTMNMPSVRPAGDLYVAMLCHDGTGSPTAPAGWTAFSATDTDEFGGWYRIGTDQGGGNEAASYNWTGITEQWTGVIMRVKGFNSGDPIAGTPGTTNTSGAVSFPATTPDNNATLVIRGAGVDDDPPSTRGWVPSAHTKIYSGTSSADAESCGFAAASLNVPPASGVSTGAAATADTSMNGTYGALSVAINPTTVTPATQSSVYWAKFNSSTLAIESPNPGNGVCSEWCTNSAYDLPEARRGFSMVAYNGYLYVIGGIDGSGNREATVLIAKIGANGEPQLWHPSGGTAAYWYSDTGLSSGTGRSYLAAVAYNNRMYIVGGATGAAATGTTTMEYADINPTGTLGSWSSGTALPSARYRHTAHIYNDVLYLIGGDSGGTQQSTVHYSKLNSNGSMNSWVSTSGFTTARSTWGGSFSTIWGGYIYIAGGCTATTGASNYYCNAVASDTQLASINADGSLSEWGSITNLHNQRTGFSLVAWQNGLYRLGGCITQNASTGECTVTLADVDYGVINPAGEVSTVNLSAAAGAGTCAGGTPYNCNLPDPGDDPDEGGELLSMSVILNGYLYNIGGCIDLDCSGVSDDHGDGDDSDASGNISYVAINSNGQLSAPGSCAGSSYGAWCIDSTNRVNGTTGVAAAGVTTFNGRIYIVGGLTGADTSTNIYHNAVNADGSLDGAWESVDMTTAGIAEDVAYTYVYARANPGSAGTNPGNLFIFGGCGNGIGAGLSCEAVAGTDRYESEVYKCNITTTGSVSGCTTTGQLQIDSEPGTGGNQGLGIHSGTVNANYIYLIGGYSDLEADKDDVMIAKFDNSNNVVDADGETVTDNIWDISPNKLSVGRRRGFSFGYNGHIYSVGGYDEGSGVIPFIEWAKMNVSDGTIDSFETSTVVINQRWGLSMAVSNSYAYVLGGCDAGASPSSCTSFEPAVQTFQLYNNDSGAVNNYTLQSDQDFSTVADRIGSAAAVLDGRLYVAGGCTAVACGTVTDDVQVASISASDGTVGTWASTTDTTMPAARAWGKLEAAGGTLYYMGGQDGAGDEKLEVYYGVTASGNVASWLQATQGLPGDRTQHGAAVWNNRLYVVGGFNDSAAATSTVYVSPVLNSGGNITSAWSTGSTAFNVARTGAAVTAYANNLYLFGGFDGTNYLSDAQFSKIDGATGNVGSWTYTTSLPGPLRDGQALSANGYIYVIGGRSAATTCAPNTLITPVSANTTIPTGNNPTGIGEWYETNVRYTGDRYGAAVAMDKGRIFTMGGGCSAVVGSGNRNYYSTAKSQPQVAMYSRMIDTDTDVFPNSWLMNGIDNSIGARWNMRYRSMHDLDAAPYINPTEDCGTSLAMSQMTTWGQETVFGNVTLGNVEQYIPKESGGGNINCARYYYFFVSIDASKTFGYPEDVNRGPTVNDISLFFTSDPSKRLRHGKTFTGGEQQPLDTPCRKGSAVAGDPNFNCPLP
ncbi:MAG TPA: hypothetical protein VK694_07260 [Verrucomicrobiae bacterium]|nr:hypothetical protein [Verrucomicrobiae bacterium]